MMRIFATAAALLLLAAAPAAAQNAHAPRPDGSYELDDVEVPPRLLNEASTARAMSRMYPAGYRAQGVMGYVMVTFRIMENGTVDPQSVTANAEADPLFADAAVYVARQMRFRPAKVGGKPVRAWATLPVRFALSNHANRMDAHSCGNMPSCSAPVP